MPSKRSNVFISYRRLDKPFVRALDATLRQDGRDVWIDWEDIAPGSLNFQDDILEGIDASEAFVLVLTPDYLQSEYCMMELDYAHRSSKRLVPILHNPLQDDNVPPSISHINWVHILSQEDLAARYPQVRLALDTDHAHVETHTNLLIRAREWERRGHERSLLLRGNALAQAEQWLRDSAEKNPQPADLHAEYIHKSRQNTNYWLRIQAVIGVVMAVILGLAAFAAYQADQASQQRDLARAAQVDAERSEQTARALSLSSNALVALGDNDTDQAIALALLASELEADEPEVLRALAESSYELGTQHVMIGHADWVSAAAFTPNGRRIITGDLDGQLIVWSRSTGQEALRFGAEVEASVRDLALNSSGYRLLAGYGDGVVRMWNPGTGTLLHTYQAEDVGRVQAVAFSPDGARVYAAGDEGVLRVWDTESEALLAAFPAQESAILDMALSPDEARAITAHRDGRIIVWEVAAWREGAYRAENIPTTAYLRHAEPVTTVAWAPDSRHAVTGSEDNLLRYWDLDTGEVLHTLRGHADDVSDVDISADGRYALSASGDESLRLWDLTSGQSLQRLAGHDDRVQVARFAPLNSAQPEISAAVSGAIDEQVRVWDLESGAEIARYRPLEDALEVQMRAAALAPNGNEMLIGTSDKTLQRVNLRTGNVTESLRGHTGEVMAVAYREDGLRLLSGGTDGFVIGWDAQTNTPLNRLEGHTAPVNGVAWLPDGVRAVSASEDRTLMLWDLESGEMLRQFGGGVGLQGRHLLGVRAVAVHPNGEQMASVGEDTRLMIWDIASGEVLFQRSEHTDAITSVAYSPFGDRLLTGGADNIVLVWDTATGEIISRFDGHNGPVGAVAFGRNGVFALSGAGDETVRIWEVATGIERRRFEGHMGDVLSVAYSSGGNLLVSAGEDNTLRLWRNDDLESLINWTRNNRFVRPLDANECAVFRVSDLC